MEFDTRSVGFQKYWTPGYQNHAPSGPAGVT